MWRRTSRVEIDEVDEPVGKPSKHFQIVAIEKLVYLGVPVGPTLPTLPAMKSSAVSFPHVIPAQAGTQRDSQQERYSLEELGPGLPRDDDRAVAVALW